MPTHLSGRLKRSWDGGERREGGGWQEPASARIHFKERLFFTKLSRCQSVSQRNDKEIVTNRLTRGADVELFRTI